MKELGVSAGLAAAVAALAVSCSSDRAGGNETYTREKLMDPETCAECHPKHYEEWSGSMHAYAVEDPVFTAMNRRGQEETGGELGDFCVSCHAPLAVREGATTDGLNMESVPKHLQGVTCYFCHQVEDVAEEHLSNNPLRLANDVTMRGGIKDPARAGAHLSAYSPFVDNQDLHNSSRACGTCHDIVVPAHFSGAPADVKLEQTYAEWLTTTFAVPGPGDFSCGECHVNRAEGGPQPVAEPPEPLQTMPVREIRHQHAFFAVDTALTEFPDRERQAALVRDGLDKALRVELCVVSPGGAIALTLENMLGGHNFPSGASHDRRVWAELHVFERGVDVFQSGVVPMGEAVQGLIDRGEPVMTWFDKATKLDGSKAHMFWDVAEIDRSPSHGSIPGLKPGFDQTSSNVAPARTLGAGVTGVPNPSRVTATIWLEPVGIDVIEDLMVSTHLPNDSVKKAMPRHALLPSRAKDGVTPDPPITIAWDLDRIRDPAAYISNGAICFETQPRAPIGQ